MEAKVKSRKRKSLNSLSYGVVTRSRLRLNVNGDRSVRRGSEDMLLDGEPAPTAGDRGYEASEGSIVENANPFAYVRDLRVHRIFSSASGGTGSVDEMEKDVADYSLAKDRVKTIESGIGDDCGVRTEAGLNCGPSLEEEKTLDASDGFESNASGLGQNGTLEELEVFQERVQSTPPDAVLGETEMMDSFEMTDDLLPERYAHSRVLKPCFKPKLFGNPSSFNFRRLLPYLMGMTKGALKSIDMKPQQPHNSGSSVVKCSLSTQESNLSCITDLSPHPQVLCPSMTSDPNLICTMNTAEAEIPGNYSARDPEVCCSLSYNQTKISTRVAEVLDGIATGSHGNDALSTVSNCVYSTTQQTPVKNRSKLTRVLGDALSSSHLSLANDAAEKDGVNKDEPQSNVSCKNSTEVSETSPINSAEDPETPPINSAEVSETPTIDSAEVPEYDSGVVKCNSKPEDLIENGLATGIKGSDPEEASIMLPNEAICGSNCINFPTQQSPGEYKSDLKSLLNDSPSCKHLELDDVHATDKNDYDRPQTRKFGQNTKEFVQEPPPLCMETGSNVIETMKSILKPENQIDDGIIGNMDNFDSEQFIVTEDRNLSSKRNLNLKTRRPKVFKNYSVSYRRMLPYLTEIFGDSTYPSSEAKKVGAAVQVGDSETKNQSTDTLVRGKILQGDSSTVCASCVLEPEVTNYQHSSGSDAVIKSSVESQTENRLNSPIDLQIKSDGQGPPSSIHYPSGGSDYWPIPECLDKLQCTTSNSIEENLTKIKSHSGHLPHLDDNMIHPEPITPLGKPFVCPTRGILKRNPRGCRGMCTCLNCASFRLHAEKAFDFSRNQLLDSEEIALELIDELSFLRNLLKKSDDGGSGKTSQVQVQEACVKAYTVELKAKARFEELHNDLNIHCKIPNLLRPRVSFAMHFEGKSEHLPSKQHRS